MAQVSRVFLLHHPCPTRSKLINPTSPYNLTTIRVLASAIGLTNITPPSCFCSNLASIICHQSYTIFLLCSYLHTGHHSILLKLFKFHKSLEPPPASLLKIVLKAFSIIFVEQIEGEGGGAPWTQCIGLPLCLAYFS